MDDTKDNRECVKGTVKRTVNAKHNANKRVKEQWKRRRESISQSKYCEKLRRFSYD